MLIRMEYHLQQGLPLSYRNASLFQGMLMQRIDREYGEVLHRSERKPYSQYLQCHEGQSIWVLQTLTDEAAMQLIDVPNLQQNDMLHLEWLGLSTKITAVKRESLTHDDLLQQTFSIHHANCIQSTGAVSELSYSPAYF